LWTHDIRLASCTQLRIVDASIIYWASIERRRPLRCHCIGAGNAAVLGPRVAFLRAAIAIRFSFSNHNAQMFDTDSSSLHPIDT
jgi:hypothetical protein